MATTRALPRQNGKANAGDSGGIANGRGRARAAMFTAVAGVDAAEYMVVPIGDIVPSPHNVRRHGGIGDVDELAASIKAKGVIEPLVLEECSEDNDGEHLFHLIAGERRWTA